MENIDRIVKTIDKYLEDNHLYEVSAVEANEILAKKGVLKDCDDRPGFPLRKLLRNNLIPTAEYKKKPNAKRGFWFIHHSN